MNVDGVCRMLDEIKRLTERCEDPGDMPLTENELERISHYLTAYANQIRRREVQL